MHRETLETDIKYKLIKEKGTAGQMRAESQKIILYFQLT